MTFPKHRDFLRFDRDDKLHQDEDLGFLVHDPKTRDSYLWQRGHQGEIVSCTKSPYNPHWCDNHLLGEHQGLLRGLRCMNLSNRGQLRHSGGSQLCFLADDAQELPSSDRH